MGGPSGFAFYPGTGLPASYNEHFMVCDYRGGKGSIIAFALKPKGASFEITNQHDFLTNVQATDVLFGVDGRVYASVWYGPINQTGKGRIYTISDPKLAQDPAVLETKKLIGEGFDQRTTPALLRLLAHVDQRVRQEAQFALAERGAVAELGDAVSHGVHQLSRLHAIWGLGQIARKKKSDAPLEAVLAALNDADVEVRTQAARVLGECRCARSVDGLIKLLQSGNPRARLFAAQALGQIGDARALPALTEMLRENNDLDLFLRHAGAFALFRLAEKDAAPLLAFADDKSPAVRMAVLLALRRMESPALARFLNDAEPKLIIEAARAINDVPILGATPVLASLLEKEMPKTLSPGELFSVERINPPANKNEKKDEKKDEKKEENDPKAADVKSVNKDQVLQRTAEFSTPQIDPRDLRISAVLPVQMTGAYTFWVTGSATSELWLSTDEKEEGKRLIALCKKGSNGWDWSKQPEQTSYPIQLTAGKRYYIEAVLLKSREEPEPKKEPAAEAAKKTETKSAEVKPADANSADAAKDKKPPEEKKDQLAIGWQFPNGRIQRPITALGMDDQTALQRRVLSAGFRTGGGVHATAIARIAGDSAAATALRKEALLHLGNWGAPPLRDAIVNLDRPVLTRDGAPAATALAPLLERLLADDSEALQAAAATAAGKLGMKSAGGLLFSLVSCDKRGAPPRLAALRALAEMKDPNLLPAIRLVLETNFPRLRREALALLADQDPKVAVPLLEGTLARKDVPEKQSALAALAKLKTPEADTLIVASMQQFLDKKIEKEIQLDVLEAAQASADPRAKKLVDEYLRGLPADDEAAPFAVAQHGGNGDDGKKIAFESTTAQCLRCHKVNGVGGDVGPDLKGIGKKDRAYLLSALITPSAQIAQGFETVLVKSNDGTITSGILKKEDETELTLTSADGKPTTILKSNIAQRRNQQMSTMPPMGEVLTKREIRHLVEYLSGLK